MMMRDTQAETGVSDHAATAVGYLLADPVLGNKRASEAHEQAFRIFCSRTGKKAASLVTTKTNDPSGYWDLLASISRSETPVTVFVTSLAIFGDRPEDAALCSLEIEHLGSQVQVMNEEVVDSTQLACKVWPPSPASTDIRERIKTAMRNRAIRGEGLGKPPYGYRIGKTRKLEVHQAEAEAVKLIFTLYTQKNMGIRLIVRHLNENSISTRKGGNWSLVTVRDILRNRSYLGTYTRFGIRVPGSHAPIVTPDMFRWAQSKMDERKPKRGKAQSAPFLLSGMIYCGFCGRDDKRMVGVTRRQSWTRRKDGSKAEKQYRYYQCQARTNQSMCQYHTLRAQDIEDDVLAALQKQRNRVAGLKGRKPTIPAHGLRKERQKLTAEMKTTERRIKQAAQAATPDADGLRAFKERAKALIDERLEITSQLQVLEGGKRSLPDEPTAGQQAAEKIDDLAAIWAAGGTVEKRALLTKVVDRVTMFDNGADVRLKLGG